MIGFGSRPRAQSRQTDSMQGLSGGVDEQICARSDSPNQRTLTVPREPADRVMSSFTFIPHLPFLAVLVRSFRSASTKLWIANYGATLQECVLFVKNQNVSKSALGLSNEVEVQLYVPVGLDQADFQMIAIRQFVR